MSFSVTPPRRPADTASSSTADTRPSPRGATQQVHAELASRARGTTGTETLLAPRNQIGSPAPGNQELRGLQSMTESMTHWVRHPQIQTLAAAFQQLGEAMMSRYGYQATEVPVTPPAAPRPYVAPSVAGDQCVPLAEMGSKGARLALLGMGLSPQFLDAMKADLDRCTNPFSGWGTISREQFVQTYGQLVAMPNGLDSSTVTALKDMLASPEPSTPPTAQAAQPPQTLPVMEMSPENARAALRAMEVAPEVLARMTEDVLGCVETAGSEAGQQRAQQFRHDYGHLLALPQHMDAATLTDLVNLLMDLDQVEPQADPHAARQPDTPPPPTQRIALGAMEPAETLQALLDRGVPEQELSAMANDLHALVNVFVGKGDNKQAYHTLAYEFAQTHGHLIELPEQLDIRALHALVQILKPYRE